MLLTVSRTVFYSCLRQESWAVTQFPHQPVHPGDTGRQSFIKALPQAGLRTLTPPDSVSFIPSVFNLPLHASASLSHYSSSLSPPSHPLLNYFFSLIFLPSISILFLHFTSCTFTFHIFCSCSFYIFYSIRYFFSNKILLLRFLLRFIFPVLLIQYFLHIFFLKHPED